MRGVRDADLHHHEPPPFGEPQDLLADGPAPAGDWPELVLSIED